MQKKIDERVHRLPVRLYPAYLPATEGKYLARTVNDPLLSIDEIGASMKNRGGLTGSYEDAVGNIRLFLYECMYQMANGFGVNLEYYSLVPHVGGVFSKANESQNDERHPVSIRYRPRAKQKEFTDEIDVVVDGLADCTGWIDEFIDVDEDSTNALFAAGDQFILTGSRIKADGTDPACGVFFVAVDDPTHEVRVTRIAEQTNSKIIGICPQTGHQYNKIVIRTQYSGSSSRFLKTVRTIESSFVIEEA
jgi:hypothetical protein